MTVIQRIKGMLVPWRNLIFERYHWSLSKRELVSKLSNITSSNEAVEQVFAFRGHGYYRRLRPDQFVDEITLLLDRVSAIHPKVIVEIGTRYGGTLFLWSQSSKVLELLVSIDLPSGRNGGGYADQRSRLYRLFTTNRPHCRLELLRLDSQVESTRAVLLEILAGRPIDFLFIDADHRYVGVKKDYQLYAPLVRPGGLIAFHDIRPNPKHSNIEVHRLWDEIKVKNEQTQEIIHQPFTGQYGIGVVTKL